MAKIAIDAGHGLYTPGKRCLKSLDPSETREWVLNSRIASYVVNILKDAGHSVIRTDDVTGKTDKQLNERTRKANIWNADYLVSIHHNAGVNGGAGGGIVVIRQNGVSGTSKKMQDAIYAAVVDATGLKGNRSDPKPTQNLHMTRESKMPAVLIECGFMDSSTDVPIILRNDFAKNCASGIAKGIMAIAGGTIKGDQEMTKEEVKAIIKEVLAEASESPSASLADEWNRAKAAGITDGTNPQKLAKREEVAAMIMRAIKQQ